MYENKSVLNMNYFNKNDDHKTKSISKGLQEISFLTPSPESDGLRDLDKRCDNVSS